MIKHCLGLVHTASKMLLVLLFLGTVQFSMAQEFVWAPDFPVGATIAEISAQDQDGNLRNFDNLKGEKGMLYMLSRSFNW